MERLLRRSGLRDLTVGALLLATILTSLCLSFVLLRGFPATAWAPWFGRSLAAAVLVQGAVFVGLGVHRGMWRYAGLPDLVRSVQASAIAGIALVVLSVVAPAPEWLVSVAVLDGLLTAFVLSAVRVAPRLLFEWAAHRRPRRPVVVLGAGDAGEALVREMGRCGHGGMRAVAFLDDDPAKQGRSIHGVPVLGPIDALRTVAQDTQAEAVLVAIGAAPGERMRRIRTLARSTGLPVKCIPTLADLLSGRAGIAELRDLDLEELLARDPVRTDHREVEALLAGRCVLVTGAAGSIGSELSRQVLAHAPRRLVVLDQNENALFELEHALRRVPEADGVEVVPVLANVRDGARVDEVFGDHRPEVVFHAAAYKHVPVLEHFPEEAVRSNVQGTRNVARAADRHGVERFVLISTDKAVRPTSVMGTTKRVAELVVGDLGRRSRTRFSTIRFGNVLGSAGSVMQVFREQIARGGPVTVTHPDMRRFFMSIPEAVELVLFAASMDDEGSTFVLDMGEPVRILDLARHYIRLCGLEPDRDVRIEFTGLRPGEKLYEELWTEAEQPRPTPHRSILRARREIPEWADLDARVDSLVDWAEEGDRQKVVEHLRALVPEYQGDPVGLRENARPRPAARLDESVAEKSDPQWEPTLLLGVGSTRHDARRPVPEARTR